MDLEDSFIFKQSPEKQQDQVSPQGRCGSPGARETVRSRHSSKVRAPKAQLFGPVLMHTEVQCDDLMNLNMLEDLEVENATLKQELAKLRQTKPTQVLSDSETVQKYKFDNQILMRKLSEYKKAEKGAIEIVQDYEEMK